MAVINRQQKLPQAWQRPAEDCEPLAPFKGAMASTPRPPHPATHPKRVLTLALALHVHVHVTLTHNQPAARGHAFAPAIEAFNAANTDAARPVLILDLVTHVFEQTGAAFRNPNPITHLTRYRLTRCAADDARARQREEPRQLRRVPGGAAAVEGRRSRSLQGRLDAADGERRGPGHMSGL